MLPTHKILCLYMFSLVRSIYYVIIVTIFWFCFPILLLHERNANSLCTHVQHFQIDWLALTFITFYAQCAYKLFVGYLMHVHSKNSFSGTFNTSA